MAASVERLEREARGEGVLVPLGDAEILVPPVTEWRSSAIRAIATGDSLLWAQKTLGPDDLELWREHDPNVNEVKSFFADWQRVSRESLGESSASSSSSRRTARR